MYVNWTKTINKDELGNICELIKNEEIIIFPTETVYGIGGNALSEKAISKIFLAKGRPQDNPLIVHVSNYKMIHEYAKDINEIEEKLIKAFMPGPFTLILKKKDIIPNIVSAGLDTIGIRMPENKIAREIIESVNLPIAAPSANISGKPSGTSIEDIRMELENKVSAIIDGGVSEIGLESTVVRVIEGVPTILRPGKVTPEQIEEVVGAVKIDDKVFKKLESGNTPLSPGMKYRHYAPNTKCKLIYSKDEEKQINAINELLDKEPNTVVIGFNEHKDKINSKYFINIGEKDNFDKIAKNIYSALREADKIKANLIIIEGIEKKGIGIAIMNRMLRTCEFDYIEK